MRYIRGFALALTLALLVGLAGPGQAQKALKIFMVPKFTGAAYFAATEKGAKEAVAELKGRGVAIDFLYTGPSVANTDEEIRMIDDLVAQKPDAIIISANDAEALVPVAKKALFAKNAGKLQGKTARQVAAIPGPATTLNGLTAQGILSVAANATMRKLQSRPVTAVSTSRNIRHSRNIPSIVSCTCCTCFLLSDLEGAGDFERDAMDFWENVSDFARELFWKWVSLF